MKDKAKYLIIPLVAVIITLAYTHTLRGVDEIMSYNIPKGYVVEKNIVYEKQNIVSIHYHKGYTSIYFIILSHNGKAVMGSDGGLEEWFKEGVEVDETADIKYESTKVPVYLYYPNNKGKTDMIEGVFYHKKYLVMVGMTNYNGDYLTEEELNTFYNLLKSIELK